MKKYLFISVLALAIVSCKPTEKNYADAYSKAYEAARQKAEAEQTDDNGIRLESIEGPQMKTFGTDSVKIGNTRLKPFETDSLREEGNYGIAISRYTMPTNARRHLQDVINEYPNSFMAMDGKDGYFVIIKRVASIPDAADIIRVYKLAHPNEKYLGLDGEPAVYFVMPK